MKKKLALTLLSMVGLLVLVSCKDKQAQTAENVATTINETIIVASQEPESAEAEGDAQATAELAEASAENDADASKTDETPDTESATVDSEIENPLEELFAIANGDDSVLEAYEIESTVEEESEEENAVMIQVYYHSAVAPGMLTCKESPITKLCAEDILAALLTHNVVSIETKVEDFKLDADQTLHLDLNKDFAEYINIMSDEAESMMLAAITYTYLDAYQGKQLYITVDGKPLETASATYADALDKKSFTYEIYESKEN